ncbi:ABC transporter substrate-binding protein [Haladaptatus caseinilyticus]|uniref:ABC transporter substrate-binding protein n=1 Tax=Haladaptatus caseinilyticus TaxID=2993314 RepID=UPI00224B2A21|nr:extracellular solute-binding protein [Haladaptatus caseinilyticus]
MANNENGGMSRRDYAKYAGLAGVVGTTGLAGCLGGGNGDEGKDGSKNGGNKVEVQHWWTGGDGNAAITALFEGFEKKHDITVKSNPVSGGAGQNLKNVIKKRVLNSDPPSTWQAWPGKNLHPYVEADKLEDIGESVWSKNDMKNAYLKGPKEAAKPNGKFVTVPLNIHRLNNLFYNVEVVEKAGVDPSSISKPSDLVDAMKTVENNTNAVGMAHQTKSGWSTLQLWAQVLLGEHGEQTYAAFTDGKVKQNKQAVKQSLSLVKEYHKHFNGDAGSIDWQQANKKLINGKAAFIHQGDWAAGMYRAQDSFEFEKQWNMVPFPGTKGKYSLVMDSFPFPKNNPTKEETKKFLQYVGSVDAQERFNPKKGSIPPRTDVPKDKFGPFLSRQMDQFKSSKSQPPSIAHGLATTPETLTKLDDAATSFNSSWNVDKTYNKFVSAFEPN